MNLITKMSFLGLSILFASYQPSNANQPLLDKADEAHLNNSHHLAIKYYTHFFETNEVCHESINRLAESYWSLYQIEDALEWYQIAYNCEKMPLEYLKKFGDALSANRHYEFANKIYQDYTQQKESTDFYLLEKTEFAIIHSIEKLPNVCKKLKSNSSFSECSPAFYKDEFASVFSGYISCENSELNQFKPTGNALSDQQILSAKNKTIKLALASLSKKHKIESFAFAKNGIDLTFTMSESYETRRPMIGEENLSLYTAKIDHQGRLYQVIKFPHSLESHSMAYGHFSQTGNELYFASNQPGGQGGFDIYVSSRKGTGWSTPTNLGPSINTPGNEISPFSSDGKAIYFSSDYYPGMGGFDIFMAKQVHNTWSISNLGTNINSSADDYDFIFEKDNKTGYFTSNKNGATTREDIYKVSTIDHPILLKSKSVLSSNSTVNSEAELMASLESSKSNVIILMPISIDQTTADTGLSFKNNYQLRFEGLKNIEEEEDSELLSERSMAHAFHNWKTNLSIR